MRTRAVIVVILGVCLGPTPGPRPAWADEGDGTVVVTPGDQGGAFLPPTVDLDVRTPGHRASNGGGGRPNAGAGSAGSCSYTAAAAMEAWLRRLPSRLPAGGQDHVDPSARLYARVCAGQPVGYVWLTPSRPWVTSPSAAELARRAYRRLVLAVPVIGTSPPPAVPQLVRVPVWLWLERSGWRPRRATAAVPGLSATAVAVPVRVEWSMGEGTSVVCAGPGTVFRVGVDDPYAGSPDCGHTYPGASTGEPGGVFTVTARVSWRVSWSGGGRSGVLPALESTGRLRLRVVESQAVNR